MGRRPKAVLDAGVSRQNLSAKSLEVKLDRRFDVSEGDLTSEMWRTLILVLWPVLICCVVIGLLPARSPVIMAVGRLHVSDKVLHFGGRAQKLRPA